MARYVAVIVRQTTDRYSAIIEADNLRDAEYIAGGVRDTKPMPISGVVSMDLIETETEFGLSDIWPLETNVEKIGG